MTIAALPRLMRMRIGPAEQASKCPGSNEYRVVDRDYLWGDVPALMPVTLHRKVPGFNFHQHENTGRSGGSFQSAAVKNSGGSWFAIGSPGQTETGRNLVNGDGVKNRDADGYDRHHPNALGWKSPRTSSGAKTARKAASALIAKIPLDLARHIARCYKP